MRKVFFNFYLMVIVLCLFLIFVCNPVLNIFYKHIFKEVEEADIEANIEHNRKLATGAFYVMEQDLLRLPMHLWIGHIESLKPRFSYGIAIANYADLQLNDDQKKQLRQGEIVCVDHCDYIYHQVGESQMVLSKGPLSDLEPTLATQELSNKRFFIISWWSATLLLMAIPTTVWMLIFWRKLRIISLSAAAFGNGDFDARTHVGKRSALTPIAHAFNNMADRIQQLINSHKDLTNAVSHELRSPIARIRFGLEMQTSSPTAEKKRRYTQGLLSDVKILEDLVTELLTFARFDREKPQLKFQFHSATLWLKDLFSQVIADNCRVSFRSRFPAEDKGAGTWFEPKYLGRAVENLLRNAMRHANQQVHLILEYRGQRCFIHVDDDGPGVAEADRKRIFEPFTRLDDSRSRKTGGYGLGLAIVQRILDWHSGGVSITDSPLGGARFSIYWPRYGGKGCEET